MLKHEKRLGAATILRYAATSAVLKPPFLWHGASSSSTTKTTTLKSWKPFPVTAKLMGDYTRQPLADELASLTMQRSLKRTFQEAELDGTLVTVPERLFSPLRTQEDVEEVASDDCDVVDRGEEVKRARSEQSEASASSIDRSEGGGNSRLISGAFPSGLLRLRLC